MPKNIPPLITPDDLIIIRRLENEAVALFEQMADLKAAKEALGKLEKFIVDRFFSVDYYDKEKYDESTLRWSAALEHSWRNLIQEVALKIRPNAPSDKIIAGIRAASNLFESFMRLQSLPSTVPMKDLVGMAIDLATSADQRPVRIRGLKALNELSLEVHIAANKHNNFVAILELLTNAIKYSSAGSEIILRFKHKTCTQRFRISGESHQYLQPAFLLTVYDQGIGIPAAEITNVLRGEYRASNTDRIYGTGFGLASITSHLGTKIRINSPISKNPLRPGTAITVRLIDW